MCNALRTRMVPGDQSVAKSSRFLGLTMLSCGQVAIVSPCGSGLMLPVSAGNIPMAMFSRVVLPSPLSPSTAVHPCWKDADTCSNSVSDMDGYV